MSRSPSPTCTTRRAIFAASPTRCGANGASLTPAPATRCSPSLQKSLRAGQWKVTAAVRDGRDIVGVWPGLVDRVYGVAVDIGSTTIAAHLSDLTTGETLASAGVMNPQIRFGEDLMSRVSYVMLNPGGDREMTAAIRDAVAALVADVAAEARIDPGLIVEMTAVGNPIMHHLFLGLDPVELGGAPFALTVDRRSTRRPATSASPSRPAPSSTPCR